MSENVKLLLPELYVLIDIFRAIDNGFTPLRQLFNDIVINAHQNRSHKTNRCEELAMFAEAFTSINQLDIILGAFENQVADPSFNESPPLAAISSTKFST
jgi:hypothetical protein